MTIAVAVFPGSNCEHDVVHAIRLLGGEADLVWHRERDLGAYSGVILPGGFAHGDYLRTGAIARFSPIMGEVARLAAEGAPVLGICNGFQVLCESGLLPGALIANRDLRFVCRMVELEVTDTGSVLTAGSQVGDVIRIPLNSYEGNYVNPSGHGRVALRYTDDPNGSQDGAAAVTNDEGNVVGVMPHPERAVEAFLGSTDGRILLDAFLAAAGEKETVDA